MQVCFQDRCFAILRLWKGREPFRAKEVFNMYVLIALVLLPFVVLSELLKLTK